MKKIIPFKKDIIFKTNLAEIISISLEHNLKKSSDTLINGEFIINGTYKMTDSSVNIDEFNYKLPFDINMSDKYIIDKINIDIDDFFYEIINNNILSVNIDVLIDNIEEKPLIEKKIPIIEKVIHENLLEVENKIVNEEDLLVRNEKIEIEEDSKKIEETKEVRACYEEEKGNEKVEFVKEENIVKSLFESIDDSNETYSTYKIYIVRDGDTIESIIEKYKVEKEVIEMYNDINNIKLGDKLIIPALSNEKV